LKKILLTNLKNSELEKLNTIGKQYEPE
jgi:hypothetical protein